MENKNITQTNFIIANRNILESSGIIEVKHLDIPPKTYYKINEEKLLKVLKNSVVENIDDKRLKI